MKLLLLIRNICLYGFVIFFFIAPRLQPILFGLAFFLTLFTSEFKTNVRAVLAKGITGVFFAFFIIYVLSGLYSENTSQVGPGIELKLSFLLFPLFFPILLKSKNVSFKRLLDFLFLSVFVSFFILFFRACYRFLSTNDLGVFFSSDFSLFMHPSYLAVSLNLILLIIFYRIVINAPKVKGLTGPVILLCVYIVLTASKIGLILLFFNLVYFVLFYGIKRKKITVTLSSLLGLALVAFLLVNFVPRLNYKFNQAYQETLFKDYSDNQIYLSSTGQRIVAWKTSIKIIKENPLLGVGIGDIREELQNSYVKQGYVNMKKGLDSHQQFLQTQATVGVAGSVILFLIFTWMIFASIKRKKVLLLLFSINILLFGLTESMFETQAGVLCFLFFFYIFEDDRLESLLKEKSES